MQTEMVNSIKKKSQKPCGSLCSIVKIGDRNAMLKIREIVVNFFFSNVVSAICTLDKAVYSTLSHHSDISLLTLL